MHFPCTFRAASTALLLGAGALGASGQIFVEAVSSNSIQFAFRSSTAGDASGNDNTNWDAGMKNQADTLAGLRVKMTFDATLRTLQLDIDNISGTGLEWFAGTTQLQMGPGTLTGFAFDVNPHGLALASVNGFRMLSSANDADVNFTVALDQSPYGGGGGLFAFDIGTDASGSGPGLDAGGSASFLFTFADGSSTPGDTSDDFDSAVFDPAGFFGLSGAEFYARFQETTVAAGSDKVVLDLDLFVDTPPVPEPSTYGMIAVAGLAALVAARRRFRRRA